MSQTPAPAAVSLLAHAASVADTPLKSVCTSQAQAEHLPEGIRPEKTTDAEDDVLDIAARRRHRPLMSVRGCVSDM
jgi:hypothetical protein